MKEKKIKISAVSYLNTLPFLYGIEKSGISFEIELSLDMPSDCAKKLLDGSVDIGLVPVAIIPHLKEYHLVSDYCIGADGQVDSVALFSDVPLEEIESVYLDYQSKTSVNLVKLLADEHWRITPKWLQAEEGYEDSISNKTAGVIIGDRTFNLNKTYKFKYDLAEQWKEFTGLPFVFACWVSNKKIPSDFIQKFNSSLKLGLNQLDEVVKANNSKIVSPEKLNYYLKNNISYMLDSAKKEALDKFLSFMKQREILNSEYQV